MKKAAVAIETEIDIDAILNEVKHVRASLHVTEGGIEALLGDDFGYFEADAMLTHIEKNLCMDVEQLDRVIDDLRKGGATDYDMSDKISESREG
jgi:hypothetical protein